MSPMISHFLFNTGLPSSDCLPEGTPPELTSLLD